MISVRRTRVVRYLVTPVTLLTFLSGCTKWGAWQAPGEPSETWVLPDRVRVTYQDETAEDGQRMADLESATVERDSLVGFLSQPRRFEDVETGPGGRIAIPLTEITRVEKRVGDGAATAGLILGILAVGVGLTALAMSSMDFSGMFQNSESLRLDREPNPP